MQSLEAELEAARQLAVDDLADAIESIGFECTRCGACCKGHGDEDHTATVFPDEVRELEASAAQRAADNRVARDSESPSNRASGSSSREQTVEPRDSDGYDGDYDWRDVARPMPYGLSETEDGGLEGETFEWALQTDSCGDCTFYEEDDEGTGACVAHDDRPLICRTYPFSIALAGTSQPMGAVVDSVALGAQGDAGEAGGEDGVVRAHECEGLGRDISREDATDLAHALKERAVRELEEAIAVRDTYEPAALDPGEVVVHDSEGAKEIDGTPRSE